MENSRYNKLLFEIYNKSTGIRKFTNSGVILNEADMDGDGIDDQTGKPVDQTKQPEDQQQQTPAVERYPKKDKIDKDKDLRLANKRDFKSGVSFMYAYFPKWQKILPFYDMLPVMMLFRISGDRMWGFNMHYIPPHFREQLVDTMMRQKRGSGGFSYLRIRKYFEHIPYNILKYCVREYLYSHIVSRIKFVPEKLLFQLLQETPPQFKKQSAGQIYQYIIRNISSR